MPKGIYKRTPKPDAGRFATKYTVTPAACWEWTAGKYPNGYGAFFADPPDGSTRRVRLAHRVAYELFRGPIPAGLVIDHLCHNRACVNPEHLEAVTMRENLLRGDGEVGRHARQTHCKFGHPLEGDNLRIRVSKKDVPWRVCRACNRRYYHERAGLTDG